MQVTTTPGALALELEQHPAGGPGHEVLASEAAAAIAALISTTASDVCPDDLVKCTADDLAMFSYLVARMVPTGFTERAAATHGRALRSNPSVAALQRAPEFLADVEAAAASLATPQNALDTWGEAQGRAAAAAREKYMRLIAAQLRDAGGELARPALEFLAALELRDRVEAARARHVEAAAAAAEKAAAERRAAEVAAIEASDKAEIERLLLETLTLQRLPADLPRTSVVCESKLEWLAIYVPLVRRLKSTRVDGVRVGQAYYAADNLARSIGSAPREELIQITRALDRAEGKDCS